MSLKKLVDTDLLSRFLTKVKALIPAAATASPEMDGTANVGTSVKYAREDHVHPAAEVGGRNYLRSTINPDIGTLTVQNVTYIYDPETGAYTLTASGSSSGYTQLWLRTSVDPGALPLLAGKTVKISVQEISYSKSTLSPRAIIYINGGDTSFALGGGYATKRTVTLPSTLTSIGVVLRFSQTTSAVAADDTVVFRGIKLELGDKWTDWTPDPTDVVDKEARNNRFALSLSGESIPANADLDDYTTAGNFYCSAANASSVSNTPTDTAGLAFKLAVMNMPSGRNYQLLFPYDRARVYLRYRYGTNWYAWHQLVREDDLPEAATATPLAPGTAAVGVSTKYALEDHVHPAQTTINGHTVNADVPSGAVFTDTTDLTSMTGTLSPEHGGTGNTTAKDAANGFINALDLGNTPPTDSDYFISQFAQGNGDRSSHANANKYYRRSFSYLWSYISDKINSIFAATATPSMDGTSANVGTSTKFAREDHVHPRDSKVFSLLQGDEIPANSDLDDYTTTGNYYCTSASNSKLIANSPLEAAYKLVVIKLVSATRLYQIALPNSSSPRIYIRYYSGSSWTDWVNLRDADKVNGHTVESDVPANAVFTDTTYTPASATPLKDGTGAVGTSAKYAREDHVHPTDTTRAALASPTFTGTPKAPTATAGTNTTQIATTEFVGNAVSGKVDTINGLYYGECDTAAATAAKTVTLTNGDGFSLVAGAKVCIRFENANSASNPTLNVNSTGAKPIVRYGTTAIGTTAGASGDWSAGGVVLLVYDGTSWVEHYWHNNTYSSMTVAEYTAGTGTTGRTITPARLKAAIAMHSAPKVYTASIPTTGWTTASAYGAYIDVTFTGATFTTDDTVFVDLNLSSDTNLQTINDAWSCLLRATPTASSAKIRFKFSEVPTVAIPVRAVVL